MTQYGAKNRITEPVRISSRTIERIAERVKLMKNGRGKLPRKENSFSKIDEF